MRGLFPRSAYPLVRSLPKRHQLRRGRHQVVVLHVQHQVHRLGVAEEGVPQLADAALRRARRRGALPLRGNVVAIIQQRVFALKHFEERSGGSIEFAICRYISTMSFLRERSHRNLRHISHGLQ